jgi:hypothetical protein
MRNCRCTGYVLAAPAALAAAVQHVALGAGSSPWPGTTVAEFAILWSGAAIALGGITHIGASTTLGREALALRRAAYPLGLLRDADPIATVALYGGTVRRSKDASTDSDSGYVWAGDLGSSGHGHDGSGGHVSYSCASTCGSGGCGGH